MSLVIGIAESSDDARYEGRADPSNDELTLDAPANVIGDVSALGGPVHGMGLRFLEVQIQPGSTIDPSFIVFVADDRSRNLNPGIIGAEIRGEASDNPLTFSDITDYKARPRTSNYVLWDMSEIWDAGAVKVTPDISAILQEIIDRPSWVAGNSIVLFLITDPGIGSNEIRSAYAFDTDPSKSPELDVSFTDSPPPPPNYSLRVESTPISGIEFNLT